MARHHHSFDGVYPCGLSHIRVDALTYLGFAFIFGVALPWAIGVATIIFVAYQYYKYWLWRGIE